MFSSIIGMINELCIGLSNGLKKNFFNYNNLETAIDTDILVARDGSLLTVLSIDGIREIISPETYYFNIIARFSSALASSFEKGGHVLQSCFHYDPTKSEMLIDEYLRAGYKQCEKLNLDLAYMLDAQKMYSKDSAAQEKNFLLLWTNSKILSKQDAKTSHKNKVEEFKKSNINIKNSANPFIAHEMLIERHRALVYSVVSELNNIGVVTKKLDVITAIREIRMGVDEEYTGENWQALLPGDRVLPTQLKQKYKVEEYDVFPMKLSQQICNKDAEIIDNNVVKIANTYYSPMYINFMPKEIDFFYTLFNKLIQYHMPWRVVFTITGDGMASMSLKNVLSQVLGITSSSNKLFNNSANYLKDLTMNNTTTVKFQIAMTTWADNLKTVKEQASKLARIFESWGSATVSEITGNPVSGLASASMGFTSSGIAQISVAPLEDAITMLPLSRPSALWDSGALILKSPDGKLLPYQPMSSLQTTWITLIFAGPGSGKSVFANLTNIALCLSPGLERLPLISILDVGPSSKGFIEMMKDALPPHQKKYALYVRLSNTEDYAMNMFDLPVCCRFPMATLKQWQKNMLIVLLLNNTPKDSEIYTVISKFCDAAIDEAYQYFCDSPQFPKSNPKKYTRYTSKMVDDAIDEIGYKYKLEVESNYGNEDDNRPPTTWFEISDTLFKHGKVREAIEAHKYVVPLMTDLSNIVQNSRKLQDEYANYTFPTGETIFEAFSRLISSAIRAYPILSTITRYSTGESRIISLDLDEVAKDDDQKTSVMYMYGLKLLSSHFFLNKQNVEEMPFKSDIEPPSYTPVKEIKEYHAKIIDDIRTDKKRLYVDEFHRTSKSPAVRDQILIYMREGRKWGVEIILASQSIDDYDETMIEFATTTLILSAGKDFVVDNIVKKLGVNDKAEIEVLKKRIRGPNPQTGNIFVAKFDTKNGNFTQLLNNKMGPIQIWALTTTQDDMKIRDLMFSVVGSTIGRKILAEAYPYGSAANEVEERRKNQTYADGIVSVHEEIVVEAVRRFGPKYGISRNQALTF